MTNGDDTATTVSRVAPIRADEWNEQLSELYAVLTARHPLAPGSGATGHANAGDMFLIVARHPGLCRAWTTFTTELRLVQTLSDRDRELIVLRTGWRCQAPYIWGQHVRMAREANERDKAAGFTHDEIEAVVSGPTAPTWTPAEAAVLRAVDDLHDTGTISDRTWATLATDRTPEQLVELPTVCGWYHLLAYVQNALHIPEPGAGLEAR